MSATGSIYWRRLHGYPATTPRDVEVVTDHRETGPCDGDWHEVMTSDIPGGLGLDGRMSHPILLADALVVYAAIQYRCGTGVAPWEDGDWEPYSLEQLDDSPQSDYETLCDALSHLSDADATKQAQRLVCKQEQEIEP